MEPTEEVWVYAGARWSRNQLVHSWQPPTGPELYYGPKMKGTVVGAEYTVRVVREGTKTSLYGQPVYRTASQTQELADKYHATDQAARIQHRMYLIEKNDAKQADLSLEAKIIPLRRQYRNLSTNAERDAFLALIMRKVTSWI